MFMDESNDMHQLMDDSCIVNAFICQRHLLSSTNSREIGITSETESGLQKTVRKLEFRENEEKSKLLTL